MPGKKHEEVLCLYHDDADGRCSAAIVRKAVGRSVNLQPIDYGDPVPWDTIDHVEKVIMVDFSLPIKSMKRIHDSTAFIWIDHHKTALEDLIDLSDLPGKRELNRAACVLTWEYFYPEASLPMAVAYIGDRDVWKLEFPKTKPFNEGLFFEDSRPFNDQLWERLLDNDQIFVSSLIEHGEVLYQARMLSIERLVNRQGFEVEFNGHRTLAVNNHASGELGEVIREKGYEIAYCYNEGEQNGELMTFVTLYSDQVDVSEIARKYGGGGHPGAAGFSFRRGDLPFPKEPEDRKPG